MNEWQVQSKAIASPMTELGALWPEGDRKVRQYRARS
jgi:hypothetical protein